MCSMDPVIVGLQGHSSYYVKLVLHFEYICLSLLMTLAKSTPLNLSAEVIGRVGGQVST